MIVHPGPSDSHAPRSASAQRSLQDEQSCGAHPCRATIVATLYLGTFVLLVGLLPVIADENCIRVKPRKPSFVELLYAIDNNR